MKNYLTHILPAGLCLVLLSACIKDKGNYTYNYGNPVTIRYATYNYNSLLDDTTKVYPLRTFSNPNDTSNYDHAWYIGGQKYSTEPILKYVGKKIGSVTAYYYMIDRKSGISFPAVSQVTINTNSPFQEGWGILYEENNESELAHIRFSSNNYISYKNLYKTYNEGESLGSAPVKIRDYRVNGGRGMMVLQNGGQGSVELNAYSFKKQLVLKNSFTTGTPSNLVPVDMGFFSTTDLLVNNDGKMYSRIFPESTLPFSTPWITSPVTIPGGMLVSDIWDSWSFNAGWAIMYDKQNKRLLRTRLYVPNMNNPGMAIDTFPLPTTITYPPDYTPLNNFGSWQYVWGGTFNDNYNTLDAGMLLRSPDDNNLYWQTFKFFSTNGVNPSVTPGTRIPFQGNSVVTPNTKFAALKTRNYLFFSGGAGNKDIYYYDLDSNDPVKKYTTLNSPVTVLTASDDNNSLAVGLEDGTFILFNVSTQVIIDGTSPELYRLSGLGKVVDIIVKGGRTN